MFQKIKEQWFIVLIALILTGSVIYFVVDQNKDVLRGKSVEGKDVVVEINGENIFADDLFADIPDATKQAALYMYFERLVVANTMETTNDLKSEAKLKADELIASYKEYYGSSYEDVLLSALQGVGYSKLSDLETYFINTIKAEDMIKERIDSEKKALFTEVFEKMQSRSVSHILVMMEDSSKPTDEEKAKLKEVEDALKGGMSFADAAKEFSEDGSASNGGSLGYMDKDTSFVPEFLKAALALKEGETSTWVKTQYGYHLIRCDIATVDGLLAAEDIQDALYTAIDTYYPELYYETIWEAAEALDIQWANEETKTSLKKYMGLED
ncbi:MAG: peptidylprolyl isomerase [Erysipelotrichaceae bacterium]